MKKQLYTYKSHFVVQQQLNTILSINYASLIFFKESTETNEDVAYQITEKHILEFKRILAASHVDLKIICTQMVLKAMRLNEITEVCNKQLCQPFLLFTGCYCLSLIKFPMLKNINRKFKSPQPKQKTKPRNPPNYRHHQYQTLK